jgi:cardiolipin synthase
MFVWRNDDVGNEIGAAVLRAAERGVRVRIKKDRGAIMYERIEMNRRSFFDSGLSLGTRLKFAAIRPTFPDTRVRDDRDGALGEAIRNHPRVTFQWVDHTHTKYYIIDERIMITGSVNVEDRHLQYHDYMVEIEGEEAIRRFRDRDCGKASFDAGRDLDFLLNHRSEAPPRFEIKKQLLRCIAEAQHAIYVEMA